MTERYNYLYDTTPKAYNVDPIFVDYMSTQRTAFASRLNLIDFLQKVTAVSTTTYNKFPATTLDPIISTTQRDYDYSVLDYSFVFDITRSAYTSAEITSFGNRLTTAMEKSRITSKTQLNDLEVSRLLKEFELHMYAFQIGINLESFTQILNVYKSTTATAYAQAQSDISGNTANASVYGSTIEARSARLRKMKVEEQGAYFASFEDPARMFTYVVDAAEKSINDILQTFGTSGLREFIGVFVRPATMNNTNDLKTGSRNWEPSTNQKWCFLFHGTMMKYLNLPSNILPPDNNSAYRTKCTLIEAFIRGCYPFVQYLILAVLTDVYRKAGDLVNARHGLIARAIFSFHTINALNSLAFNATPSVTLSSVLTTDFTSKIGNFIEIMSRPIVIAGKSNPNEIASQVVRSLQDKSKAVVKASESIEVMKASILKNQLALRSVTLANTNNARAMFWRNVEMITLFILLITVLIVASVLYLMNKAFIGFMISSVLLAVLLLYLLTLYIIKFLKSSST